MTRITGSALDRIEACPASAALPAVHRSGQWASAGTAIHAYLERLQTQDRDTALAAVEDDEHRALCAAVSTEGLPLDRLAAEVTYAFNPMTWRCRYLGQGLGRDYSQAADNEIVGTIDVAGKQDGVGYVCDYKSFHINTQAAESRQIHLAALCLARLHNCSEVRADIIALRPGSTPWVSRARFTAFDLDSFAYALTEIHERAMEARVVVSQGRTPAVTEGEHCRYCPCTQRCPAKIGLVRELGGGPAPERVEDLVGELTPDTAARAWRRLLAIEAVTKLVRDRIEHYAMSRPVPLGEGRYLGPVQSRGRERLDGQAVYERVSELYGLEVAEVAAPAERSALKKTVKAAVREARDRGLVPKMAVAERALLDDLRQSGGATTTPGRIGVGEYEAEECSTEGCAGQAGDGGVCGDCALSAEMKA